MNNSSSQKVHKGAVVDFTNQGSIDDQAARWVAKLDFDEPDKETFEAFKQWINQSSEHRTAFESYVGVWGRMNILSQLVPPREQKSEQKPGFWRHSNSFFAIKPWLVVCSLLVAVVLIFQNVKTPAPKFYTTEIGEQATFKLNDGSTALLNTNSRIEVRYTRERRLVRLDYGEVHFDVMSNPDIPFEVYAGQGLVRAIGTAFTVHLRKDDVEVVVTEGVVEIGAVEGDAVEESIVERNAVKPTASSQPHGGQNSKRSQVLAGSLATYDRYTAKHILLAELDKIDEKLSWHNGLLVFEDEPLEKVVAEVGRYTATRILIPERKIRQLKIGGQFKVGDTAAMFEALKISFNIHAKVISEDLIYLVLNDDE